ncbi:MAG: GGDEF domain-containing protein [Alteromonadales bacterium]|nr:GGDEF domain-containing protein [Alteromonadales bacterium]
MKVYFVFTLLLFICLNMNANSRLQSWQVSPSQLITELETADIEQDLNKLNLNQLYLSYLYQQVGKIEVAKLMFAKIDPSLLTTPENKLLYLYGIAYTETDHLVAISKFETAINYGEENDLNYDTGLIQLELAYQYMVNEKFVTALNILQQVHKIATSKQLPILADVQNAYGVYYLDTGQLQLAEKYFIEAEELAKKVNSNVLLHKIFHNQSVVYTRSKQLEKSKQAIDKMVNYSEMLALPLQKLFSYLARVNLEFSLNNFQETYDNILLAEKYLPIDDLHDLHFYLFKLKAETLSKLSNRKEAINALTKAKAISGLLHYDNENESNNVLASYYQTEARVYQSLSEFKNAYYSLQQYSELHLQAEQLNLDQLRTKHEIKYEVERNQLEKKLIEQKNDIQELELIAANRLNQIYYIGIAILIILLLGSLFFVSRLSFSKKKLHLETIRDPLTNLFNRRYFDDSLAKLWANKQKGFSIISLDIDHFKSLNDNYGHAFGDHVLQEVSKQFLSCVRQGDIVARVGGEEFVIFLPDTNVITAEKCSQRIRHCIEKHNYQINDKVVTVTISAGLTHSSFHGTPTELLKSADIALYGAKNAGRNCVVIFSTEEATD